MFCNDSFEFLLDFFISFVLEVVLEILFVASIQDKMVELIFSE